MSDLDGGNHLQGEKQKREQRYVKAARWPVPSAAAAVKGLRSLRDAHRTRALDRRPRCVSLATMKSIRFSYSKRNLSRRINRLRHAREVVCLGNGAKRTKHKRNTPLDKRRFHT
jgi:hypothetical protein